ncbi:LCP family protein [Planococcus salinus]|uniref:LytR family transcriptional regulator n=1 Tax=Planococcus salinus TaxID=1848460 RepID=A0A3M8P724_9BACL|nr:LCP family protein [Planococcus salinus]RNF39465.1 LytR family transcriptional regulator [Planococcus salinus]
MAVDGKKMAKGKKRLLAVCLVIVTLASLCIVVLLPKATNTMNEIHQPLARDMSEKRFEKLELKDKDPISVLLLGVDERENDQGRSDTMVVLTVNPSDQSTKMVSIPRDTYTEIVGRGTLDKINHAYAFGGLEMSLATTENLLDIPIDYVVQLNMKGFKDVVDAIGGVEVTNDLAFDDFQVGDITLNGNDALRYVRMRKQDPDGDFGRQNRQKQVLDSIMAKASSLDAVLNYPKVFDALGDNVRTNMSFREMVHVQSNYRDAADTIDQLYFDQGYGETINGIWYYMMDEEELKEIRSVLKEHLNMS